MPSKKHSVEFHTLGWHSDIQYDLKKEIKKAQISFSLAVSWLWHIAA